MEPRIPGAFAEYIDSGTESKKKKKKGMYVEKDPATGMPVPRVPEMDDERDFMWLGNPYMSSPTSLMTQTPNYGPSTMTQMPSQGMMPMSTYNPAQQMMQGRQGLMQGNTMQNAYGQGGLNQIQISYTAADGTMYNIGVVTPQENRGKALYSVLTGLYGLMMSEGQSGKYGGKGNSYAGKGYAGGAAKGSYAGAKGGGGGK